MVSVLVNDQDQSIELQSGDRLTLKVGLNPGMKSGSQTDYWVRAMTPVGEFWLDSRLQFIRSDTPVRAHGGPMIALAGFSILDSTTAGLPAGTYTVTFAVDDNRDQVFDETYQQSVSFTILPR